MYILKSKTTGTFYVGSAVDGAARFAEHQRGQSPYTRSRGPWDLVYQEHYSALAEARRREQQIKSWKSHRSIQQLIENNVKASRLAGKVDGSSPFGPTMLFLRLPPLFFAALLPQHSRIPQNTAVRHDVGKRQIEPVHGVVNAQLPSNVGFSQG